MTEFQNPKQAALTRRQRVGILYFGIYLKFGACNLLFPACPA